MTRETNPLYLIALWPVASLFIAGAVLGAWVWIAPPGSGWYGYYQLANDGVETDATLVAVQPQNHCLVRFTFEVDGRQYSGSGNECGVAVGEKVLITYLRSRPQNSCLGRAKNKLNNELMAFGLMAVCLPPFAAFALWMRSGKRV